MNVAEDTDLIEELLHRIERLELNEEALQREVTTLQNQLRDTEQRLTEQAVAAEVIPDDRDQGPTTAQDRDNTPIQIGDRVHILTRGVHRSREGTVREIGTTQITILDTNGIEQVRAPRNVRVSQFWKSIRDHS